MDPDFVFFVTYECPRCHAALEARASGPPSWLRCPGCNRASLPPEHTRNPPSPVDDDMFVIGPEAALAPPLPVRPRAMAPMPPAYSPTMPKNRLMLGTGFFLTTFLFLFSLLEANAGRSTLFGVAAAVFLYLLARPTPRR